MAESAGRLGWGLLITQWKVCRLRRGQSDASREWLLGRSCRATPDERRCPSCWREGGMVCSKRRDTARQERSWIGGSDGASRRREPWRSSCGRHHLLMVGFSGVGQDHAARRLPGYVRPWSVTSSGRHAGVERSGLRESIRQLTGRGLPGSPPHWVTRGFGGEERVAARGSHFGSPRHPVLGTRCRSSPETLWEALRQPLEEGAWSSRGGQ